MAEAIPPVAKRRRIDLQKTFEVLVGTGGHQKRYTIHDDNVVHRSSFFRSARSSPWCNGAKPVDLTDESPHNFEIYMHCVLTGEVDITTFDNGALRYIEYFETYALADKLGDLEVANVVIDSLITEKKKGTHLPNHSDDKVAYNKTSKGSPLRQLLTFWHVHMWSGKGAQNVEMDYELFPPELVQDIAREMIALKTANTGRLVGSVFCQDVQKMPKCLYHQHNDHHPSCADATIREVKEGTGK
ncbi:hypothetical protein LTR95_013014 [Oleoguttula sp. CCFEE 5521]